MTRATTIGLGDAAWAATRPWAGSFAWGVTGVADATLEWYAAIGPAARADDAETGWVGLAWMDGPGHLAEETQRIVRWRGGIGGIQRLLDVDLIDPDWLGWLAQWVGVRLRPGITVADQREEIRRPDSWTRGRTDAIQAAVREVLDGDRRVAIRERFDPDDQDVDHAYRLTVDTFSAETPDPAGAAERALDAAPAGLRVGLHVRVLAGATYGDLAAEFDTVGDFEAAFTPGTVDDVRTHIPPQEVLDR